MRGSSSRADRHERLAAACLAALVIAVAALPRDARAGGAVASVDPVRGMMYTNVPYRPKEFAFVRDDDGLFHLFYMRHNMYAENEDTEKDIGHAISTDLMHWTQLDSVLMVQPGTWDSSHVWAPTIIRDGPTWYMFYAGVANQPFPWNWYQRIGVATSTDLMHWRHYDEPVLTGHMLPWAFADSSQMDGAQLRDPFVMDDPDHPGDWRMYFVTEAAAARGQLIVGTARSQRGFTPWTDSEPLWCTDAAHYWGWVESPHVFRHDNRWYLFTSTTSAHIIGFRVAPSLTADSTQWSGKYRLFDFAGGRDRNSDAWFASEFLSIEGHDFLAYVDSDSNAIGIEEMVWGTPPNFFSLKAPSISSVTSVADGGTAGLRLVGRARHGAGGTFAVTLPEAAEARLVLFDVAGRRLREVAHGVLPRGESVLRWDGRDEHGRGVPCSIVFARLETSAGRRTARFPLTD